MPAISSPATTQPTASQTNHSSEIAQALHQTTYALELIGTAAKLSKRLPAMSPKRQAAKSLYILELIQIGTKLLKQSSPALISAGLL